MVDLDSNKFSPMSEERTKYLENKVDEGFRRLEQKLEKIESTLVLAQLNQKDIRNLYEEMSGIKSNIRRAWTTIGGGIVTAIIAAISKVL